MKFLLDRHSLIASTLGLVVLAGSTSLLLAGPLSPPAGSVTPSYKTLSEVEPRIAINATSTPGDADSLFKISQPGSYYLTGNIVGVLGKNGIEIDANNVTIDLNGFHLKGVVGAPRGVWVTSPIERLTIANGTVSGWAFSGIEATSAERCMLHDLIASSNGSHGISVGSNSRVERCVSEDNGQHGFDIYQDTSVVDCTASLNAADGINSGGACRIVQCSTNRNAHNGIKAGGGSTVRDCIAASNVEAGIYVSSFCVVEQNNCYSNGTPGIGGGILVSGSHNRVRENACNANSIGVSVQGIGNLITRNSCASNTLNWSFAAGNAFGPIVAVPLGPAVSGNSATASLNTTDSNANFTH